MVPWSEALDESTHLAHIEAFADHWGSEPRTEAEWKQWYTGHRGFREDLSVLAVDSASGMDAAEVLPWSSTVRTPSRSGCRASWRWRR